MLPGQLFPYYRWGLSAGSDPAGLDPPPGIRTERRAVRGPARGGRAGDHGFPRAAAPARLGRPPLLTLLGVRAVVTGADDDFEPERRHRARPRGAAAAHRRRARPARPPLRPHWQLSARGWRPRRRSAAPGGPPLRPTRRPRPRPPPSARRAAGRGRLGGRARRALGAGRAGRRPCRAYAADLRPAELRRVAAAGSDVVVTDSNRRRAFVSSRPLGQFGPVMPADTGFPRDAASLDPFARGSSAQTVATYSGARDVRAPYSAQLRAVPGAPTLCRLRRRPPHLLGGRPGPGARPPLGGGPLQARARCPTWTSCRRARRKPTCGRSRSRDAASRYALDGTACPHGCGGHGA